MIELLERLGYYPRFCVWELTLACDMRCQHCGSFAGTRRPDELDFDEQLSVAEQLIRLGCEKVTLGGGEPTLHPRWYQLGKYLTDGGVRVNIISNGWGWDERQQVTLPMKFRYLPTTHTAVSAGYHNTCALRADGGVDCWGWPLGGMAYRPETVIWTTDPSHTPPYVINPLMYRVRTASFCMSTLAAPGNQQKLLANVTCVSVESAHVQAPSW